MDAIQSGLKRLPRAVEQLRINPDTSVADLLNLPAQASTETALASPDFPQLIEEALANADVMEVARNVARTHKQLFKCNHLRTDFVMMVLYGLVRQTL